jgi:hypothetical protein
MKAIASAANVMIAAFSVVIEDASTAMTPDLWPAPARAAARTERRDCVLVEEEVVHGPAGSARSVERDAELPTHERPAAGFLGGRQHVGQ